MSHPAHQFYLTSNSPRRAELLNSIGLTCYGHLRFRTDDRADAEIDEKPLANESAIDYVKRVAQAKACHGLWVAEQRNYPPMPTLAADTTLDIDGDIVGKPADAEEARAILQRLSARTHRVITVVAMADKASVQSAASISQVSFRALTDAEVDRYVASNVPLDKAGAYGIQGYAGIFVSAIQGSYSGIVGLPLCETAILLRRFGIDL